MRVPEGRTCRAASSSRYSGGHRSGRVLNACPTCKQHRKLTMMDPGMTGGCAREWATPYQEKQRFHHPSISKTKSNRRSQSEGFFV